MAKKHLIIGCGSAGLAAVDRIRSITPDDEIKVISREPYLPYSPTSLPYLLADKIKESDIWVKDTDYFHQQAATFLPGKEVVQLLTEEKRVIYSDGDTDSYDTLLIATGSEPVSPLIESVEEVGFLGFHTLEDYQELVRRLEGKHSALIYGGGLVAMGLASGLMKRGYKVKIIVRSRILRAYFNVDAGSLIAEDFLAHGAEIVLGREISRIKNTGNGVEAILIDGSSVFGDIFISALGTAARVSFFEGSGIEIKRGIVVDRKMETNIQGIYAAGDVAEAPDFFSGQPGINAIIPNAVVQGRIAGSNMAGVEEEFKGWISMNVFHFFDSTACSIGLALADEKDKEILEKRDDPKKSLKRLVFQDSHLVGAMFLNIEVDPGVIRYLIENRIDIGDYKQLLLQKVRETSLWLMLEAEHKQTGLVER